MHTFKSAVRDANSVSGISNNKILLLGNGFSRACALANPQMDDDDFNYTKLLDVTEGILPNGRNVQDIFDLIPTTNFESVLSNLLITNEVLGFISTDDMSNFDKKIEQYYQGIQKYLIDAITKIHPNQQHIIEDASYKSCGTFLKEFDSIYTLNYDLLLYWVIRNEINKHDRYRYKDGFWIDLENSENGHLYWDFRFRDITFYFLHGAMHLYKDEEDNPYKLTNVSSNNWLMIGVVRQIQNRIYPLMVIEGRSSNKLIQIRENPYLNFCINSLERASGTLFTYGVSFEFDQHIIEAIRRNEGIKRIYVGVYDNNHSPTMRISDIGKDIIEYDAKEFNPWVFVNN